MRAAGEAARIGKLGEIDVSIKRSKVAFDDEEIVKHFIDALDKIIAPTKRERARSVASDFAKKMKEAADQAIEPALAAAEEEAGSAAELAAIVALDRATEPLKEALIRGWEAEEELELVSAGRAA